ncbi:hypothetical protein HQ447_09790 [bacterium]|nr:hypothetical protein [bacterium]
MTLDQIRQVLVAEQRIVAVFVSPSGNGIKGIARIQPDASQHKASFLSVERHIAQLGITTTISGATTAPRGCTAPSSCRTSPSGGCAGTSAPPTCKPRSSSVAASS